MINAASSKGVSDADRNNSYWKPRYVSARRALSTKQLTVQTTKTTSTAKTTCKVVKGDLLWKISKKYGTTFAKLKSPNNLKSDLIHISQKLVIQMMFKTH